MKKNIIEIALGVVIVALAIFLYSSIMEPVNFDNEYTKRRDACAEKLKSIRTLEEAYKTTYHVYTGSFDTLFNRLMNEDSMRIVAKVVNYEAISRDGADSIFADLTELEKVKKGYLQLNEVYVNPLEHLRSEGKFSLTNEEIKDLRYCPYPKGEKLEFKLEAGIRSTNGLNVPVVMCSVGLDELMSDCDRQLVVNKKDELEKANHFAGWKFGSLDEAIVDGNFE